MVKKSIIIGAGGQLGQCLKSVIGTTVSENFFFPDEKEASILDIEALTLLFENYKPQYCVNCAAYTAVDKAEDDVEMARKINKDGAENLAKICGQFGVKLIHISTDFVFAGNLPHPLVEGDIADPINVYGLTKLEGEEAIMAAFKQFYILRTSWLYSEYGNNFVKTMLRLGKEKDELKIIADQVGTPTYGIDLARCILTIIENDNDAYGVYHYSNEGVASWYDFAKAIFDLNETKIKVYPLKSSEYITKAKRPSYSVMDKSKIKANFNMEIPYWRDSLTKCVKQLQAEV